MIQKQKIKFVCYIRYKLGYELTIVLDWRSAWFSSEGLGSAFAVGVTGKECTDFMDGENKSLFKEKDLEVEGLSESGMSGIIRTVFSVSWDGFLPLKLFCEIMFLTDDLCLAELGLGGNPALVEPGLRMSILVKSDNAASKDLSGISKDERFGRLGGIKVASSLSYLWYHSHQN